MHGLMREGRCKPVLYSTRLFSIYSLFSPIDFKLYHMTPCAGSGRFGLRCSRLKSRQDAGRLAPARRRSGIQRANICID